MSDVVQLVGLGGTALIRELVKIIVPEKAAGIIKVLTSLIIAVILNIALSYALETSLIVAIAVGLVVGFASNLYNDIKTA